MVETHEPIPSDWPVQPIDLMTMTEMPAGYTSCGHCGLAWDDDIVTSMTPAPSARCPFEHFHVYRESVDIWTLLEQDAPQGCEATQDLYSWSLNYDAGRGPFALLLDLIGWSEDELGEDVYPWSERSLGYVELDKLANALKEYADRPLPVREYVDTLMAAESES